MRAYSSRAALRAGMDRKRGADRSRRRDRPMYGDAVADVDALRLRPGVKRDEPFVVVAAEDASEFVPYGRAILEAADTSQEAHIPDDRRGQVFSAPKKRKGDIGEAADIVNEFATRGRKRVLISFSPRRASPVLCIARSSRTRTCC